jgi:hypothetical protein
MPDGLSRHHHDGCDAAQTRVDPTVLVRVGVLLAAYAGAAVGGGFAWRALWTPPMGVVFEGTWIPDPFQDSLADRFTAEAWYVVVAGGIGLLMGALTAWVLDRAEVLAVLTAVVGSALAAYLVMAVGESQSPPDPDVAAASAPDGERLPGMLELELQGPGDGVPLGAGWPVLLAAPMGSSLGVALVFMSTTRRSRGRHDVEAWRR